MRNALLFRIRTILTWLSAAAVCALALLLFTMPAPARVEQPKAVAAPSTSPSSIEGIDVDYLPSRFYAEQMRAARQEPLPTF